MSDIRESVVSRRHERLSVECTRRRWCLGAIRGPEAFYPGLHRRGRPGPMSCSTGCDGHLRHNESKQARIARAATHSAGEIGRAVAVPLVDGLHHRYELRAAAWTNLFIWSLCNYCSLTSPCIPTHSGWHQSRRL